jgi:hypothetical protein
VPALMPMTRKFPNDDRKVTRNGRNVILSSVVDRLGTKNNGGSWFAIGSPGQKETGRNPVHEGAKNGNDWVGAGEKCSLQRRAGSHSTARKAASAQIAKIPFALSSYIARTWKPA